MVFLKDHLIPCWKGSADEDLHTLLTRTVADCLVRILGYWGVSMKGQCLGPALCSPCRGLESVERSRETMIMDVRYHRSALLSINIPPYFMCA